MNKIALCVLVAGSVAAMPAFAGGRYRYADDNVPQYDRYDDRNAPEYADVISAQPIYQSVRVDEPRRECWDERVTSYEPSRQYSTDNGPAGAVLGAIAGGVLGHTVGHGGGRGAATAIGAVVGAGVGHTIGEDHDRTYQTGGEEHVGYEQRCRTVSQTHLEQRVDGYDVTYRYGGRTYHTTTPYDPGRRIAVDVDVQPLHD